MAKEDKEKEKKIEEEVAALKRMGERGRAEIKKPPEEYEKMISGLKGTGVSAAQAKKYATESLKKGDITAQQARELYSLAGRTAERRAGGGQVFTGSVQTATPMGRETGEQGYSEELKFIVGEYKKGKITRNEAWAQIIGLSQARLIKEKEARRALTEIAGPQKPPGEIGGESRYGPGEPIGRGAWASGRLQGKKVSTGEGRAAEAMIPVLRQAMMWGRKQMGIAARQRQSSYIFEHRAELRQMRADYDRLRNAYRRGFRQMNAALRRMERRGEQFGAASRARNLGSVFGGRRSNAINGLVREFAIATRGRNAIAPLAANATIDQAQDYMRRVQDRMREIENEIRLKLAATDLYDELSRFLTAQAPRIAHEAALRYNLMWANAPYQTNNARDILTEDMNAEASRLSDFWTRAARSTLRRGFGQLALGMRAMSMQSMRLGDWWHLITSNIFEFIKGPWILGSLLVIVQYLAIQAWAGEYVPGMLSSMYLIFAPIITAVLLFVMNYATSDYPMQWLEHLISGAVMGLSIVLLLAGLGVDPTKSIWWFWGPFFGLFLAGAFSLYAQGKFGAIVPIAIIILIFGYASLGPYSGYVREVKDQTFTPLKLVWGQLQNTGTYLWLLVTNPTEWYARQQLSNVRPENPLDQPKGIEITNIQMVPPSNIPSGQKFYMYAIIENQAEKQTARNVKIEAYCAESEHCINPVSPQDYHKELNPGQGDTVRLEFVGIGRSSIERIQEATYAKPEIKISYTLATNSSLMAEIATRAELDRRYGLTNPGPNDRYFYPRVATGQAGPAAVSLNVGPQPLEEGRSSILAVTVLDQRSDGNVTLNTGDKIIINMPKEIGGDTLQCNSFFAQQPTKPTTLLGKTESAVSGGLLGGGTQTVEIAHCDKNICEIKKPWSINMIEFGQILPIYCTFTVPKLPEGRSSLTSLITAELTDYTFEKMEEKSMQVSGTGGMLPTASSRQCVPEVENNWPNYANAKYELTIAAAVKKTDYRDVSGNTLPTLASLTEGEENAKALVAAIIWPVTVTLGGDSAVTGISVDETQIGNYLRDNIQEGYALRDQSANFYKYGVQYNIDPAFAVAVAMQESGKGTSSASTSKNNYFGIMQSGSPNAFATPEDGIQEFYRLISENYITKGQNTPSAISCFVNNQYSPSQFSNHCYCTREPNQPEGTGCPVWVKNVQDMRGAVQQQGVAVAQKVEGTATSAGSWILDKVAFWKRDDQNGGLMKISLDDAKICGDIGYVDQTFLQDNNNNIKCGVKILIMKISANPALWDSLKSDSSFISWKDCFVKKQMESIITGSCDPIPQQPYRSDSEYRQIYGDCTSGSIDLATINFMGKDVSINKKAENAFRCVVQDLMKCNEAKTYNFWRDPAGGTYNCRNNENNPSRLSMHAFGIAIDINPDKNPNLADKCQTDIPQCVIDTFRRYGFEWGCDYSSNKDAMHFEWRGL